MIFTNPGTWAIEKNSRSKDCYVKSPLKEPHLPLQCVLWHRRRYEKTQKNPTPSPNQTHKQNPSSYPSWILGLVMTHPISRIPSTAPKPLQNTPTNHSISISLRNLVSCSFTSSENIAKKKEEQKRYIKDDKYLCQKPGILPERTWTVVSKFVRKSLDIWVSKRIVWSLVRILDC